MRPGIMAARGSIALSRTLAAAAVLAVRFDLGEHEQALKDASHRDPNVAAVFQREAVADFVEALVAKTDPGAPIPSDTERLNVLTVPEISARIADADAEQLDAIEQAELDGKARKGVLSAIEARRADLAAQGDDADEDESEDESDDDSDDEEGEGE